jgi:hypothetical protein
VARLLVGAGREVEARAEGISMGATIPAGARLRIRGVDTRRLRAGDVIACEAGGVLVTHRVVARGIGARAQRFLLTRGDAARVCDAPVPEAGILGQVTAWQAGGAWHEISAPARRGPLDRTALLLIEIGARAALEVDTRLAGAFVRLVHRLRHPL